MSTAPSTTVEAATWHVENADAGLTPEARRTLAEWALDQVEADDLAAGDGDGN